MTQLWDHKDVGDILPRGCFYTLQRRHNERYGVSNHQPHDCLLNRLFKAQIQGNIKALRHWPLWGEFTGNRWIPPHEGPVTRKMFPFDDVIMHVLHRACWWPDGYAKWHCIGLHIRIFRYQQQKGHLGTLCMDCQWEFQLEIRLEFPFDQVIKHKAAGLENMFQNVKWLTPIFQKWNLHTISCLCVAVWHKCCEVITRHSAKQSIFDILY